MSNGIIVIPAYNEEKNIEKVLDNILNLKLNIDVIVVNDGSKDNTEKLVRKKGINVISHLFNLGYGAALQTGFKYAVINDYKYAIQFDADGQHDTLCLESMINQLEKEDADIVIGSRFIENGILNTGILKKMVIMFMNCIIKLTTGKIITDPTSGFKGISRRTMDYYSKLGNFPSDYPDADILIKMLRLNYKIKEYPIKGKDREYGESMHSGLKPIIYIIKILISIFIIVIKNRPAVKEDEHEFKA